MTTPASRTAHSKATERRIQQTLWPGTQRPWKEREDLLGPGVGGTWRGEVKESRKLGFQDGCKLLRKAADQLKQATVDAETGGPFVVIHVVGCETDWAWLVEGTDLRGPYTLEEFRERGLSGDEWRA